jgi:hypothetical protein
MRAGLRVRAVLRRDDRVQSAFEQCDEATTAAATAAAGLSEREQSIPGSA